MNYLITGGCGFIGVNLVKNLIEEGCHNIRVVDNLCVGKREYLEQVAVVGRDVELFLNSITEADEMVELSKDIDIVVHLAARSGVRESVDFPRVWFDDNVLGTFNVFDAARKAGVKSVITASSSAAVGDIDPPIHEEVPVHPISPYGATKTTMEAYASAYSSSYGLDVVTLRFSNVYGPLSYHKGSLVAKFIKKIMLGEELCIYGDGKQTRDFVFVDDLLEAIKLCSSKEGIGGEIFQISTGIENTVNEITNKIVNHFKDHGVVVKHVDPMVGDVRTNWADNSKAKRVLGWFPPTNIDAGIGKTVKWFKEASWKNLT